MLSAVDEGIGNLTKAAARLNMTNVLWVVTSDNGGPSDDQQGDSFPPKNVDRNVASNWPLRGKKATVWEGGTRVLALLAGWGVKARGCTSQLLFHAVDFAPTLLSAAAAESVWSAQTGLLDGDGIDQWQSLVGSRKASAAAVSGGRTEILYNIDSVSGSAALRVGPYKILRGNTEHTSGGWYNGIAGLRRQPPAVPGAVINCSGGGVDIDEPVPCDAVSGWCLFNLDIDPCEKVNLAAAEPATVARLVARLQEYNATAVPALNDPENNINAQWFPASWPKLHGNSWVPWADAESV